MGNKENSNPHKHNLVREAFAVADAKKELAALEWTMDSYTEACYLAEEPLYNAFMQLYPSLWSQIPEDQKENPTVINRSAPKSKVPWKGSFGSVQFFFPETADFVLVQTLNQNSKYFKQALEDPNTFLADLKRRKEELPDDIIFDESLENQERIIYYNAHQAPLSRVPMAYIIEKMLININDDQTEIHRENWRALDKQCASQLQAVDDEYSVQLKAKIFNAARSVEKIAKLANFKPTITYNGAEYELDLKKSVITCKGKPIDPVAYNRLASSFFLKLSGYLPQQKETAPQTAS